MDHLFNLAADLAREQSRCLVTDADFRTHWQGEPVETLAAPIWTGVERRGGVADRRTAGHDRRWEGSRGRRCRLVDRRRTN